MEGSPSGHFLPRQKHGNPGVKFQHEKENSPNFGLFEISEITDFERKTPE